MIKTVLFDLGNVLLPFDVFRLANRLSTHSALSPKEIVSQIWSPRLEVRFEKGEMEPQAYFEEAKEACQLTNLNFDEFIPIFNDIFSENTDVIDLLKPLKKSHQLGLISNINPIHSAHVINEYDFFNQFDRLFLSHDAGIRKPDPTLYQLALDHFGALPQEALFIDDISENIQSAENLGIKSIHFKKPHQLKNDLSALGLLPKEN